ncbi:high-affinity choline transporter 1-like [Babylonia areolata]|uniref:high-affinity choline transporter 1-like n=1 Tax=Babylonia areolata TaxID=304850 RepID=UPI003FD64590
MAVDVAGVISIVVFYVIILGVGIWAGRKSARSGSATQVFLADRNMGLIVSFFTLTATMVGGAFINGTAEIIATGGLAWTVAPVGYCTGMFIGGMVYAPKMRRAGYVTMFDPFQEVYGIRVGALMTIPQFMGDVFWTAAVLSALGSTISIIMELDNTLSIILSAVIAIVYTFLGGLWSVAYTDVVQLICIAVGLAIASPFSLHHPAVDMSSLGEEEWLGHVSPADTGRYLDLLGLVALGGIPWQVYFQRVLACKSASSARLASCVAAVMCLLFAVPPAIMGLAGKAADWNQTAYGQELSPEDYSFILPLALHYLCPPAVGVLGIGTLSAAVMSSADSSILASATVFTNNMYKNAIRPVASDREMVWVLRIGIVVVGVVATVIAISVKSIYGLYIMCSDLMYVVLFPQFTSVLFIPGTNPYGGLAGFFISLPLRLLSGEPLISMPPLIKYPFFDDIHGQGFPFRSVAMLSGFLAIVVVSAITNVLFRRHWLPPSLDVLGFFSRTAMPKLNGADKYRLNMEVDVAQEMLEKTGEGKQDGVEENGGKTVDRDGEGNSKPLLTADTSLQPTRA